MNSTEAILDYIPQAPNVWSLAVIIGAVALGLFLSLFVNLGPSFINLVQISLEKGFRPASWFATGVILNDMMIITLCTLTTLTIDFTNPLHFRILVLAAGGVIFLFGLFTFLHKVKSSPPHRSRLAQHADEALERHNGDVTSWHLLLGKGFLLNLLNPFVWVFWFSVSAVVGANFGGQKFSTIVFFLITMGSCLLMELLKARAAAAFQRFFNPRRMRWTNRILGTLMMAIGLFFMIFKH